MTTDPTDLFATVPSAGRRIPRVLKHSDGEIVVHDRPSQPCPGCGEVTTEGQEITKVMWAWWHQPCAVTYFRGPGADRVWFVLGEQLAARPSTFNAATVRAIVTNLIRIGGQA